MKLSSRKSKGGLFGKLRGAAKAGAHGAIQAGMKGGNPVAGAAVSAGSHLARGSKTGRFAARAAQFAGTSLTKEVKGGEKGLARHAGRTVFMPVAKGSKASMSQVLTELPTGVIAKRAGVSERTAQRWRANGGIPDHVGEAVSGDIRKAWQTLRRTGPVKQQAAGLEPLVRQRMQQAQAQGKSMSFAAAAQAVHAEAQSPEKKHAIQQAGDVGAASSVVFSGTVNFPGVTGKYRNSIRHKDMRINCPVQQVSGYIASQPKPVTDITGAGAAGLIEAMLGAPQGPSTGGFGLDASQMSGITMTGEVEIGGHVFTIDGGV